MKVDFPFGIVELFDQHAVVTIHEGYDISHSCVRKLATILIEHFKNTPFVYISNRVHSYSVDPLAKKSLLELPNIIGLIFVLHHHHGHAAACVERALYRKMSEISHSLEDAEHRAMKWIENHIGHHRS